MENTQICPVSGCHFDRAWAVVDEKKLYRITFSKDLAEKLAKQTNKVCKTVKLFLGEEIQPTDSIQLYAICKKKSGWPLRVTLFGKAAQMWKSDSTEIRSCKIQIID